MPEEWPTMLFAALMWGGVGITLLGCRPPPPRRDVRPAPTLRPPPPCACSGDSPTAP